MAGPGCVLGQQIRAERPASRARGGGLTGACQGRIGVVEGFGWSGPQLEPPTPFALVKDFGYGAVIAAMFSFFATMGLELLATEIEEPFGTDPNDLPLTAIGETIARDVRQILSVPLA